MTAIKNLPIEARPREKANRYGIQTLSDVELLAIIIGSGTKQNSAIDIAHAMIYSSGGLSYLSNTSPSEYKNFKGISNAQCLKLLACFEISKRVKENMMFKCKIKLVSIYEICMKYFFFLKDKGQEHLYLICLNKKDEIIREILMYKGTQNKSLLSNYEIIKKVKKYHCSKIVLIHNHPNDNCNPSDEDILSTYRLKNDCELNNIKLIDHFIISKNSVNSVFKKN